jgi:peptidoglycan/xylan/chitin deacetylase (PgdA/CDA1 family)
MNSSELIRKLKKAGHYVGPHSDKHLLYCDWKVRDSLLVSKAAFLSDLHNNFIALAALGIPKHEARTFIPPYEWYNDSIVVWSRMAGLNLLNFTPGTLSHTDYTTPDMKNYRSSDEIYKNLQHFERSSPSGMNGFYLLMHIGAGPKRKDKFYKRLSGLMLEWRQKGYTF